MKPFLLTLVMNLVGMSMIAQQAPQAPQAPQAAPAPPLPPRPGNDDFRDLQGTLERVRARAQAEAQNSPYQQGTNALDRHDYPRAIDLFDRVITAKSPRADGAYYWKAYALNKLGRRDEALAALAEIPKQFPQSRWINDAKALEAEVKLASGQGIRPEDETDEDLKLLAINALMNSDPYHAMPLLEGVLNNPKNSPAVKERALFVLAQNNSDRAHEIVFQYAKSATNPDLQLAAIRYLGTFRNKKALDDLYAAMTDETIKREILNGLMLAKDTAFLANAARTETNPDLRRDAITDLGTLHAQNELGQLYATEANTDLKEFIIHALFTSQAAGKLVEIAKAEKDPRLKKTAVQMLAQMRQKEATDYLMELLK